LIDLPDSESIGELKADGTSDGDVAVENRTGTDDSAGDNCHDLVKSDYHLLFLFPSFDDALALTLVLRPSHLLMRHHPMQTLISDSFLVISDSSYDSP